MINIGRTNTIKDYNSARAFMGSRRKRKLANNTYLEYVEPMKYGIRYHNTLIVIYGMDGSIKLSTGGWHTVTTKERLSIFSPVSIYQRKHVWYVSYLSKVHGRQERGLFDDGMVINQFGRKIEVAA